MARSHDEILAFIYATLAIQPIRALALIYFIVTTLKYARGNVDKLTVLTFVLLGSMLASQILFQVTFQVQKAGVDSDLLFYSMQVFRIMTYTFGDLGLTVNITRWMQIIRNKQPTLGTGLKSIIAGTVVLMLIFLGFLLFRATWTLQTLKIL